MPYSLPSLPDDAFCLEEPRIKYISRQAKGVYANILLDDWFKRTFEELPGSKRLLTLLLQELIPERRIVDIRYAPQEYTNPNPDKRGIRVDVEATDADGTRFLVEMQREPQATILDNFCFSLHNMQFLEERPAELRQEIFELLFETAEIATFTPEDKVKYEFDMTTERDIRNQIRFAEKQAAAKAAAKAEAKATERTRKEDSIKTARLMLAKNYPISEIVDISGLTEEQVRGL